jgi:hypothetical protein
LKGIGSVYGSARAPRGHGGGFGPHLIPKEGSQTAYWAIKDLGGGNSLRQCAFRGKTRVARLLCIDPALGDTHWTLEVEHPRRQRKRICYVDENDKLYDFTISQLPVVFLTQAQGGREWYMLRKFRVTGSVASHILHMLQSHQVEAGINETCEVVTRVLDFFHINAKKKAAAVINSEEVVEDTKTFLLQKGMVWLRAYVKAKGFSPGSWNKEHSLS